MEKRKMLLAIVIGIFAVVGGFALWGKPTDQPNPPPPEANG